MQVSYIEMSRWNPHLIYWVRQYIAICFQLLLNKKSYKMRFMVIICFGPRNKLEIYLIAWNYNFNCQFWLEIVTISRSLNMSHLSMLLSDYLNRSRLSQTFKYFISWTLVTAMYRFRWLHGCIPYDVYQFLSWLFWHVIIDAFFGHVSSYQFVE